MMNMRKRLLIPIVPLLVFSAVLPIAGTVLAAEPPGTSEAPGVELTIQELQQKQSAEGITIRARLSSEKPLGNQPVDFFVEADFFIEEEVYLDTVITDATGTAVLTYEPKWQGTHVVTARFPGDPDNPAVETTLTFEVADPVREYEAEQIGLAPVRNWTPVVVGLGVVAVWGLLLFTAFRTLKGISQGRN
jgi:hypothetical protein